MNDGCWIKYACFTKKSNDAEMQLNRSLKATLKCAKVVDVSEACFKLKNGNVLIDMGWNDAGGDKTLLRALP